MLCFIDMADLSMIAAEIRAWMDTVPGIDVHGMEERACVSNVHKTSNLYVVTESAPEYPQWTEQVVLRREVQYNEINMVWRQSECAAS